MLCSAARPVVFVFLFLAACVPALANEPGSVWVNELGPRDRLEVRAAGQYLRFDMVDPATGEALASLSRDGSQFGPADRVYLLGATAGRHPEGAMFVRMGRVEVGKRVELAVHDLDAANRRLTAPVQEIRVTRLGPAAMP